MAFPFSGDEMGKDAPPAVQWYPRDFAAAMHRIGADDRFELAYRRALDASFEDQSFGVGSPEQWCQWGRVTPDYCGEFLRMLALLVVTCPDGTLAQVRMARDRMETDLFRRGASRGGRASAGAMTDSERSDRARIAARARWDANPCLPMLTDANTASASASASASATAIEPRVKDKPTRPAAAFVRPTLAEVQSYCAERLASGHRSVDPQAWFDHYTANGWRVGRNPMRDWKAAVRTWERSGFSNGSDAPVTGLAAAQQWLRDNPDPEEERA